eukprot:4831932-Amphidinium_carterae.1
MHGTYIRFGIGPSFIGVVVFAPIVDLRCLLALAAKPSKLKCSEVRTPLSSKLDWMWWVVGQKT